MTDDVIAFLRGVFPLSRPNTLAHLCARNCDYACLLVTLGMRSNVNVMDKQDLTPLGVSISTGCIRLSASLLQADANPNFRDSVGSGLTEGRF